MKIRSLRLRLIFSFVFVIIFTFGLIGFFLDKTLEENSLRDLKASLINQAYLIEAQLSPKFINQPNLPALEILTQDLSSKIKSRITIISTKGEVLVDSEKSLSEVSGMDSHATRPEVKLALDGFTGEEIRYSSTLKINMLYVAVPIRPGKSVIGVIRLALPLVNVEKMLKSIRNAIIFSIIFALSMAFVLGSLFTAGIIKPINRIIQVSRNYSKGDFSHKIYHNSQDEIGELSNTLNEMASDIEEKIKDISSQGQQLKAIFNSMIEGVILTDKVGRVASINQAVERIFEVKREDVEGKIFLEAIRNNDIAEVISSILNLGEPLSKEITLTYPVQRIFEVSATPIFYNNSISGSFLVIHDMTEIRRLETIRRDFVANVSHELKTPLTSIKGFVETLLGGALEDKDNNRNFLKIIQDHADRLDNLVDDLLSLSQLESKVMAINKKEFSLSSQIEDVVIGFKTQIKGKGIEVINQFTKGSVVNADKDRIEQVLVNLIDNAIKFNKEHGTVMISNQDLGRNIKVIIEDSGIGIPERDISRIFERFYRVDKARSRELGGTGLGLSIAKHIIELHGGSIGVDSTEGLGSKFWFILPK